MMKAIRCAVALSLALVTAGCERAGLFLANLPGYFSNIRVVRNVAFGPTPEEKLDIYLPAGSATAPHDVIVFFYGGRWTSGSKDDYGFVGHAFATRGFIVVIPDYAKYPAVKFPVFVQDGAKALAWVYDTISTYGGTKDRIHVAGHSSGAHIGALLAADASYLEALGKDRSAVIHDFAGLAGPYSFVPDEPDLEDMFGPPANYPRMQVTSFIDGTQPPMLLAWGADDTYVGLINIQRMAAAVGAKGGCLETKIYPGADHVGIVAGLSWINPDHIPVLQDMTTFFAARPAPGACPSGSRHAMR
jgi:acetyl esterase/lipase